IARNTPSVYISDNSTINPESFNLTFNFINNIVWGTNSKELEFKQAGQKIFDLNFSNNLIRTTIALPGTNNIFNQDPFFINPRQENYRFSDNSIAVDKGTDLSGTTYSGILSKDIENKLRVFPSDLGAYEK